MYILHDCASTYVRIFFLWLSIGQLLGLFWLSVAHFGVSGNRTTSEANPTVAVFSNFGLYATVSSLNKKINVN